MVIDKEFKLTDDITIQIRSSIPATITPLVERVDNSDYFSVWYHIRMSVNPLVGLEIRDRIINVVEIEVGSVG